MSDWTLTSGLTTQTLKAWGFNDDISLTRSNQTADICTATIPGQMDPNLTFPFGQIVKIHKPDGSIWFQGRATLPQRMGSGNSERIQYQFAGPWFDLENVIFEQSWQQFNGYTDPSNPSTPPTFVTRTASEIFLGYKSDGTRQTTGQQVTEALNWAIGAGANLQIGTIGPSVNFPYYNARDLTCAEVVRQMLRWTPDTIVWFDYTTTPPTINAVQLPNLSAKTISIGSDRVKSLRLRPRPDLVLNGVVIRYKIPNEVNGVTYVNIVTDKYPTNVTEQHLYNSVNTIELFGARLTTVTATIKTAPINAASTDSVARTKWWQGKVPWLKDTHIDQNSITVTFVSATDTSDPPNPVDLTAFPNELIDGQIASWMNLFHKQETKLHATVSYNRLTINTNGTVSSIPIQGAQNIPIHCTIKATNGVSGTYSTIQSAETGDPIPAGLAQSIWTARSVLQHEGEIELVGSEIPAGFGMGQKITIGNLASSFTNMLVQQISEEPFYGRMRITVGPPQQIGIADLIELMRANRYRLIYNLPQSMQGSAGGSSGDATLGDTLPKQDSTADSTPSIAFGVSQDQGNGTTAIVHKDATVPQLSIKYVQNTDPTASPIASQPSAIASLPAIAALGLVNTAVAFRTLKFKDAHNNCQPMIFGYWGTIPEVDPNP